jgi:hypothetical protein
VNRAITYGTGSGDDSANQAGSGYELSRIILLPTARIGRRLPLTNRACNLAQALPPRVVEPGVHQHAGRHERHAANPTSIIISTATAVTGLVDDIRGRYRPIAEKPMIPMRCDQPPRVRTTRNRTFPLCICS